MGAWQSASGDSGDSGDSGASKSKSGSGGTRGNRSSRSLEVRNLAGRSLSLGVDEEVTCAELASAIEAQLGLSAEVQEWIVDGPVQEVLGNLGCSSKTLAAAGLGSDVRSLTVLHIGFTPMALLPERFLVQFKSSRQRFGTGYSSAFASLYYLRGDAAARQMVMEPWRKNDHDKFIYDMGECTMKAITSHWMSGSTEKTQALNVGFDPLAEFLQSWQDARCRRVSEEDAYWRKHVDARDADIDAEDAAMAFTASTPSSLRPKYGAVPGWFVEPSSGCTEILCEATVGQLKILRLLINQDGEPIRAALHLQRASPLHEEVEEFDVTARELQPGEPLQ